MRNALSVALILANIQFQIPSFVNRGREIPAAVEEQACMAYNSLTDYWKKRAIKAWRSEYQRVANPALLERNDPPYFPPILPDDKMIRGSRLRKGNWGHLNWNHERNLQGVFIEKILDNNRVIAIGSERFIISGIETMAVIEQTICQFPGAFHVIGYEMYGSQTLIVVGPLPSRSER